jgi:hypothetical protein
VRYWVTERSAGLCGRIMGALSRAPPPPKTKGCVVKGMSMDSHRRMLEYLMDVDWKARGWFFVTLTYTDGAAFDAKRAHEELKTFWKRAARAGALGLIWKLEMKRRQSGSRVGEWMAHWHLIVRWPEMAQLVSPDRDMAAWVHQAWSEVVGAETITQATLYHERKGFQAVMLYMAKYAAKVTKENGHPPSGRIWGVRGVLPTSAALVHEVAPMDWPRLVSRIRMANEESPRMRSLSPEAVGWTAIGMKGQILDGLDMDRFPHEGVVSR